MNEQNNNNNNESLGIKRKQPRYIMLRENIFQELSSSALLVYLALRYVADYSRECSSVEKKIKYLCNQAKVSRAACFRALKELEKNGLVKRESNSGDQSTYWVAQDLNFFEPLNKSDQEEPPVSQGDTPVSQGDTPVSQGDTIITNSSHYSSHSFKKESEPQEPKKLKHVEYAPTLYETCFQEESHIRDENEHNLSEQSLKDFIGKTGAKNISITMWMHINNELRKCAEKGYNVQEAFNVFIASNWKSFRAEYIIKEETKKQSKPKKHDPNSTDWAKGFATDRF